MLFTLYGSSLRHNCHLWVCSSGQTYLCPGSRVERITALAVCAKKSEPRLYWTDIRIRERGTKKVPIFSGERKKAKLQGSSCIGFQPRSGWLVSRRWNWEARRDFHSKYYQIQYYSINNFLFRPLIWHKFEKELKANENALRSTLIIRISS